ncbi:MAG: sigma-70 family RNA polymerase sigma factor, partial [Actinomycetota bacterium]|nr:sigma-70 family RNA polymerase sigma factor [Actinomycetota bacterium]
MAVSIRHRPGPETTRALLEQIAGGDRVAQLRSQVASWNPGARAEQIEEAFQEACARSERSCTGQTEGEVYTWLRTTTHHELGRMRQVEQREVLIDVSNPAFEPVDRSANAPVDELIDREDEAEIERLTRAVLDQLSERQRAIAALHSNGLRRRQIAEHLDLTPRVVKRSLEQLLAAGRDELVRIAGHGCDAGEGLVARFAFGLGGPRESRQAQLHLATCPRCGAMFERLDLWREKVAVLLPVPAVAQAHSHIVERVAQTGTDVLSGARPDATEGAGGLRRHASDAAAQVREHLAAAYYRTIDPTPLTGVRPGAVAAAVAGCLAIGGGATYCVQQGVDPIAGLTGLAAPHHDKKPKRHAKRARVAQAPAPP